MNSEINLKDIYYRIIKYWWILVLAGLVGGLISLVISFFNAPLYEAHASIKFGYDFDDVNGRNISQSRLDYMESKSSLVVNDSSVINQVIQSIRSNEETLGRRNFSIQRRVSLWDLVVRSGNPQEAAEAANLWQTLALQQLEQVRNHGIEAFKLTQELDALNNCIKFKTQNALCDSIRNLPDLTNKISDLTSQIDQETKASLGITMANLFEAGDKAQVPDRPIAYDRNLMVLIGTLVGLMLGFLMINFSWFKLS